MRTSIGVYLFTLSLLMGFVFVKIGLREISNYGDLVARAIQPQEAFVRTLVIEKPDESKSLSLDPSPDFPVEPGSDPGTGFPDSPPAEIPEPEPAFKFVLPTENDLIFEDPPRFYMHTNRWEGGVNQKPWQGGQYGFVRDRVSTGIGTVYTRLHEGIDIRPIDRDDKNVPLDDVRSMSEGTVVYVNDLAFRSNYGKYIVVRHDWPEGAFYSLYAHLASVSAQVGELVEAGGILGRVGHTGIGLDRERAHVHVELTLLLSERFATDYRPGIGHQNFNGINLVGIDLARFLREYHEEPCLTMKEFLDREEPYFTVITRAPKMPGILERHPCLGGEMKGEDEDGGAPEGWEFTFARSGVPLTIAPCRTPPEEPVVTWVKTVNTNHSYMTAGRLKGSGSKAVLSERGKRYVSLISEAF